MSREVLLAAIDAAATEAEWDALMQAMERDPALMDEWSRWWALRDAQQGVALSGKAGFCGGVMAAIAADAPLASNVVAFPSRAAPARAVAPRASRLRAFIPLSAAAGVIAAVLALGPFRNTADDAAPAALASNTVAGATPVAFAPQAPGQAAGAEADRSAILNAYLIEHSNTLAERSMGGTLANARFAVRTASFTPDTP